MIAKFRSRIIAKAFESLPSIGVVLVSVTMTMGLPQRAAAQGGQSTAPKPAPSPATAAPASPAPAPTAPSAAPSKPGVAPAAVPTGVPTPPDYVIGPEDILSIVYWRDKDMTNDVTVRPDGNISLPLLNDVHAAGLTPAQLRDKLTESSKQFLEDPNVTVIVKQINSRKVYITGEVTKPGTYALIGPTTVLQLIAMAGGLREYADSGKIVIVRNENGKQVSYPFDYKGVTSRKNLKQNIDLKTGDTVIVP